MVDVASRKFLPENIKQITSFMDLFEHGLESDFYTEDEHGYYNCTNSVMEFIKKLYSEGFISYDFDWGSWLSTIGEDRLRDGAFIAAADISIIQKILTTIIRGDKYNEGLLASFIRDGTIRAVLRRLVEIQNQSTEDAHQILAFCAIDGRRLKNGKCEKCKFETLQAYQELRSIENFANAKYCVVDHGLIPWNANFCPTCGAKQPLEPTHIKLKECINDKKMIPKDYEFCPFCGFRQVISEKGEPKE